MRKIILESLVINNFKGIKALEISFSGKETKIYGSNGSGKSSIMDAFLWLLFGKDSQDRKDFDIKNTVDTELNRQDHEVIGFFQIDGNKEVLKHVYRENWVKKQGSKSSQMDGHEHVYFWNDVPLKAGEYKEKVDSLLKESVFKLITSALYFNSLPWQEQRSIIEELAGTITDQEIIDQLIKKGDKGDYSKLLEVLGQRQTIEDYRKVIAVKKKSLKTSLDEITPRIDECYRLKPEPIDSALIEDEILKVESGLADIEILITDRSKTHQAKNQVSQAKKTKVFELKSANSDLEFKIKQVIQDNEREARNLRSTKEQAVILIEDNIKSKSTLIQSKLDVQARIEQDKQALRDKWELDKAREFVYDESKFSCPTCNRDFETDNINESKRIMRENFDNETKRILEAINKRGGELNAEKDENDNLIKTIQSSIDDLNISLKAAQDELTKLIEGPGQPAEVQVQESIAKNKEYQDRLLEIQKLETELSSEIVQEVDYEDLRESRSKLTAERDELKQKLSVQDKISEVEKRIEDLKSQESTLATELSELEGVEYSIECFTKAKIDIVESRTNDKFKHVTFKMFTTLINGGVEPTCVTMYKGVPWRVLNTASRINAGLDIINALSSHYGISAPIWLDNRESTTHIIQTDAQVIGLFVSPEDDKLRIE